MKIRNIAALTAIAAGLVATGLSSPASATTPTTATLSSSGTGASSTWASTTSVKLTVGTPSSSTYAQAQIDSPGTAAPSAPPSFTTDNYAAGSPRWVIVFSNKSYLFGYPSQLGAGAKDDFTGTQWSVNNPPLGAPTCAMYDTYANVLKCADAAHSDVTQAYIVADGDQVAGTTDTLTAITYNGQAVTEPVVTAPAPTPATAPSGNGDVINKFLNGLDVYRQVPAVNNKVIVYPVSSTDPAVQFEIVTLPHGFAIEYAPHGVPTGLCVSEAVGSEPIWSAKTGLLLRGCFTPWETFNIKDAGNGSFQIVNRATGDIIQPNGTRSQFTGVTVSTVVGSYFGWNQAGVVPAA